MIRDILRSNAVAICVGFALPALLMGLQARYSLNLSDEGFFWYGVQRVAQGEVPLRDFMSYEPARYYLTAALSSNWGLNGVVALRWATVPFQGLVIVLALRLLPDTARRSAVFVVPAAAAVLFWLVPYFKVHDALAVLVLLSGLAALAARQSRGAYALAGLSLGLAACLGRNHGLYGAVALALTLGWISFGPERRTLLRGAPFAAAGLLAGLSPMLLMLALTPGFAEAVVASVRLQIELGATNLALPIVWPWMLSDRGSRFLDVHAAMQSLSFVLVLVAALAGPVALAVARWRRRTLPPTLVAAAAMAPPCAHYAFSRADTVHLALGVLPLLIAVLFVIARLPRLRVGLALACCVASAIVTETEQPSAVCDPGRPACVRSAVLGDELILDQRTAGSVALLQRLVAEHAADGRAFVAAPFWPAAYAMFERASPLWEIYALYPRPAAFQAAEIERLRAVRPGFVLVADFGLDGRGDLSFGQTHGLIHRFIAENFDRVERADLPAKFELFTGRRAMLVTTW